MAIRRRAVMPVATQKVTPEPVVKTALRRATPKKQPDVDLTSCRSIDQLLNAFPALGTVTTHAKMVNQWTLPLQNKTFNFMGYKVAVYPGYTGVPLREGDVRITSVVCIFAVAGRDRSQYPVKALSGDRAGWLRALQIFAITLQKRELMPA
jgi:hypothetical protein